MWLFWDKHASILFLLCKFSITIFLIVWFLLQRRFTFDVLWDWAYLIFIVGDKIGGTNRLWDFSKLMYKSGFENNGVSCGSVNRYPFSIIELDNWLASKYVWSISFGIFLSPLEEFYKILDEKSPWDLGLNVFCSLLEFYGLWEFKLTFILIVR